VAQGAAGIRLGKIVVGVQRPGDGKYKDQEKTDEYACPPSRMLELREIHFF